MKPCAKFFSAWLLMLAGLTFGGCGTHDQPPPVASIAGGSAPAGTSAGGPEKRATDRRHPVVQIHTSVGEITITLDRENAPISVDNFLAYIEQGTYDNTLVHQVLAKPSLLIAGSYDSLQKERPVGPPIRNEAHNGLKNVRGTIAMARRRDSIDSSTSQFFINAGDNPQLDHVGDDAPNYGYCVFGAVTAGMENVEHIAKVAVHDDGGFSSTPVEPIVVKWIHLVQ